MINILSVIKCEDGILYVNVLFNNYRTLDKPAQIPQTTNSMSLRVIMTAAKPKGKKEPMPVHCCILLQTGLLFFSALLQAEIGPAALNLTDSSLGSSSSGGNAAKTLTPPAGGAPSHAGAAPPAGRRPISPASPASKPSSKAPAGRAKSTWRVEDLEGELERKIKMLEKERQAMRKETQGQHEKINQGLDTVNHRITELEHSESSARPSMKGVAV